MKITDKAVEAIAGKIRGSVFPGETATGIARELLEAALPHISREAVRVDDLAQEIRKVDGNNSLGAARLAEALMPFLSTLFPAPVEVTDEMMELAVNAYSEARAPFWVDGVMHIGDVSRGVRAALEAALERQSNE